MVDARTVYVDDSGTHKGAKVVTAAFCVSTVEKWLEFETRWKFLAGKYGFEHFHMTEFASCKKGNWCRDCTNGTTDERDHPWRNWSPSKRKSVLTQLARSIAKYVDCGFGIGLSKKDYDDHVLNSPARNVTGEPIGEEHFTAAVQQCGGALAEWRAKTGNTGPLKFVFDLSPERQREEIASVFFSAANDLPQIKNGVEQWFKPTGISYESRKDVVQLLSADMLAWVSAAVRAFDLFGKRPMREEVYIPAGIFIDSEKIQIGYLPKGSLQQWENDRLALITSTAVEEVQNDEAH